MKRPKRPWRKEKEKREVVVLHRGEAGKCFPAGTKPVSSLSVQHPLVPFQTLETRDLYVLELRPDPLKGERVLFSFSFRLGPRNKRSQYRWLSVLRTNG